MYLLRLSEDCQDQQFGEKGIDKSKGNWRINREKLNKEVKDEKNNKTQSLHLIKDVTNQTTVQ